MSPRTPAAKRESEGASPVQTIAEHVKQLRKDRHLTAAQLGAALEEYGVKWDRFTVAALENGKRQNVTVDELFALADVFDVSPMALAGRDHDVTDASRALVNDLLLDFAQALPNSPAWGELEGRAAELLTADQWSTIRRARANAAEIYRSLAEMSRPTSRDDA